MSLESLDELKAFSAGCEVWMMAPPHQSKWTRKVDWYLSFQIMKASMHTSRDISKELQDVIQSQDLEYTSRSWSDSSSPLMIASQNYLPSYQTVVLPYDGVLSDWAGTCHKVWESLGRPTARVFLPDKVELNSFVTSWPGSKDASNVVEVLAESKIDML